MAIDKFHGSVLTLDLSAKVDHIGGPVNIKNIVFSVISDNVIFFLQK